MFARAPRRCFQEARRTRPCCRRAIASALSTSPVTTLSIVRIAERIARRHVDESQVLVVLDRTSCRRTQYHEVGPPPLGNGISTRIVWLDKRVVAKIEYAACARCSSSPETRCAGIYCCCCLALSFQLVRSNRLKNALLSTCSIGPLPVQLSERHVLRGHVALRVLDDSRLRRVAGTRATDRSRSPAPTATNKRAQRLIADNAGCTKASKFPCRTSRPFR